MRSIGKTAQTYWCSVENDDYCFYTNKYDSRFGQLLLRSIISVNHTYNVYDTYDDYVLLSIDPGKYYLKEVEHIGNGGVHLYGNWDKKINKASIAEFEVKDNDIIYIGDIDVYQKSSLFLPEGSPLNTDYFMRYNDNYLGAVEYIKLHYAFINPDKIIKRLAIPGTKVTLKNKNSSNNND